MMKVGMSLAVLALMGQVSAEEVNKIKHRIEKQNKEHIKGHSL